MPNIAFSKVNKSWEKVSRRKANEDKDFPNYRKIVGLNKSETDFSQNEKNHYPKTKILHSLCLCSREKSLTSISKYDKI